MHVLPHPPASWSHCSPGDPLPSRPGDPRYRPGRLLRPIPAASGRAGGLDPSSSVGKKKRNETKINETRGRAALGHPGRERGLSRSEPAGVSPAGGAGDGREGVFSLSPPGTNPNSACFDASRMAAGVGSVLKPGRCSRGLNSLGSKIPRTLPQTAAGRAMPLGPPSAFPGVSLQAAPTTPSPAPAGLRRKRAEKGIF